MCHHCFLGVIVFICVTSCLCFFFFFLNQELTAIKARVQELEMEEESERLKEEERCDAGDMQLLANSPRPGERTRVSRLPPG